jgi:carbonic anhydrase/acetyltransferase-like protein (isoleucine patch superfamily)
MALYELPPYETRVDDSAYIAPNAVVLGCVTVGRRASVWFNAVLRGDNERIELGDESNVQEGAVLHGDVGHPLRIGKRVSVGHQATLHGCRIGDGSVVGAQAVLLDGVQLGRQCMVEAGTILGAGSVYPDKVLIGGSPARVLRELTRADLAGMAGNARDYVERAQRYKLTLSPGR